MNDAPKPRLPQLELECLCVLWKHPGASVAEVRAALERPLAYTTVMTVLERLSAKGVVLRRKQGRAYAYSPLLDQDAARQDAVARLLAGFFENDREALLSYIGRFRGRELPAKTARIAAPRPARKARAAAADRSFAPTHIDDSLL
ncbi:MAG TPA: BlaI/MecI/CopY family transcriptional regulator [Terriglobales bacterium]|nr:BlaI/MecI/CopY family transcriptional regulator [Terriglobales bacterium]